jgi:predicted transposase YdaD
MVRDLLLGFVDEPWVRELDFDTLERISGSYVADDLRDREDDILWRVRFNDRWLYLYLLLEFQSSVDPFMAVRLIVYIGLLYQDLIKQGATTETGKLPPVLPIVLYNGKPRWTVATELLDLIEPAPGRLRDYAPRLRYLLLDEGAIDESTPWALQNLVAALFRLEKSQGPQPLHTALSALIQWLAAPEQASLRRAFTVWIKRVLLPARLPGVSLPAVGDLLEINTMLAESVTEWTENWKQQGLREGRREGLQEGRQIGRLEGESTLLERLLAKRFGPLDDDIRARLQAASSEQLETWAERLLDAANLSDVFGNA